MSDPPRRRRLRFSLRTLLIFVLLLGSATTLWWRWEPWGVVATLPSMLSVPEPMFSSDGKFIVSTILRQGKLIICRCALNGDLFNLKVVDDVNHIAMSPDSTRVVAMTKSRGPFGQYRGEGPKGSITIVDVINGTELRTINLSAESYPSPIVFSRDGRRLIGGERAVIWDADTGAKVLELEHRPSTSGCIGFETEEQRLAYEAEEKEKIARTTNDARAATNLSAFARTVDIERLRVVLSDSGNVLMTSVKGTDATQLWDTTTDAKLAEVKIDLSCYYNFRLFDSPRGERLVGLVSGDEQSWLLDARTGERLCLLPGKPNSLDVSPYTSDSGIVGIYKGDVPISLWDLGGAKQLAEFEDGLERVFVSPDGKKAALSFKDRFRVEILELATATNRGALNFDSPNKCMFCAFSPDSSYLLTTDDSNDALLWQRRREEGFLGLLALPEFWLTPLLAFALLWSLRRGA